jgi:site-specific recombinase XerD
MVRSLQVRRVSPEGGGECFVVGRRLVDEFLEFAASRAPPNTARAYAHDLKAFFTTVDKEPVDVGPADVTGFVTAHRRPRPGAEKVVRISGRESGLSASTIRRRLAAASAFHGYLITRGDVGGGDQSCLHGEDGFHD